LLVFFACKMFCLYIGVTFGTRLMSSLSFHSNEHIQCFANVLLSFFLFLFLYLCLYQRQKHDEDEDEKESNYQARPVKMLLTKALSYNPILQAITAKIS